MPAILIRDGAWYCTVVYKEKSSPLDKNCLFGSFLQQGNFCSLSEPGWE
jgi:hypothetical protein